VSQPFTPLRRRPWDPCRSTKLTLDHVRAVFTRCKDSLQNGRRLENLSWRLWFDSGRRDDHLRLARDTDPHAPSHTQIQHKAADDGWSDPEGEWEETSGSDGSSADEDAGDLSEPEQQLNGHSPSTEVRTGRSKVARKARSAVAASVSPPAPPRGRTVSVPASPAPPTALGEPPRARAEDGGRPPLMRRGFSRDCTISGGSLQRMIADLQRLPEIPVPSGKARSLHDVSTGGGGGARHDKPALGSRMSSAPDNLNAASLTASAPSSPTGRSSSASHKSSADSTRRSTPAGSPCMSRSVSSPAHTLPTLAAAPGPAPASAVPPASSAALSSRRVPSGLAMSTLPATAAAAASGPTRRSRPPTPLSPASPLSPADDESEPSPVVTMTPSETAMLALSHSRSRSDVTLSRRAQSTAELASSFKPQSFVKGFAPSSIETRPGPGRIAPPPTPATFAASLGASPPRAGPSSATATATRSPSSAGRASGSTAATPLKVPVPSAHAPTPGPSALRQPKAPGTGKKIFFISSPDSDEDGSSSRSRESRTTGGGGGGASVVVSPPSALRAKASLSPSSALSGKAGAAPNGKGKQPALAPAGEDADDSEWDSDEEEDDDDGSSGWGSEYSTDSEIARNSAAKAPGGGGRNGGGAQRDGFDTATLFAKRPADALQRTASTATMGAPGELTRRPPGLLSQLFHPEDYMEEVNRMPTPTEGMRRPHKSMSALPTMSQLRPSKSTSGLEARPAPPRSKSFLKGKPEHVELESSSEEEDEAAAPRARPAPGSASHSSEYEDVDDDAEAKAAAAAALARRQRELEEAAIAAPPQTPRTTRRAMLATELSESLRRNLLWERQMRNRVMGGAAPRRPTMPGQPLPQRPASSTQLAAAPPPPPPGPLRAVTDDGGVRAPNPSPATRFSPPHAAPSAAADPNQQQQRHHRSRPNGERHPGTAMLPRRHTTGTGLYLQAQLQAGGRFPHAGRARGDSDSELSASSDDDDDGTASPAEPYATSVAGQRVW